MPETWWQRVSSSELAYCQDFVRVGEHLAARIAAKRAVTAALGWSGPVPWRSIEILRTVPRPPVVLLTGAAEQWRRELRLPVPCVSLSHAAGYGAALAWLPRDSVEAGR
ncbi:holo-ACP synthase [Kribbella sp. NPDC050124]|uniref:holo-ACP synthase n=1 Tax=Kribbella sp. NPDC050124 TaxID=3364114 RepID=UPI00379E1686